MAAATDSAVLAGQLASGNATPIAQLGPELARDAASRVVRGTVTLMWPYNSITKTSAFLVAESDPLLRRNRGQVRLELRGPSATAVAGSGLGGGDSVLFGLDGATWETDESAGRVPGSRVEWQLVFKAKLGLQVTLEETGETKFIHVDEHHLQDDAPNPIFEALRETLSPPRQESELAIESTPISAARLPSTSLAEGEISSPALLKRDRLSYGSLYDGFDIFEEDGGIKGKGRKRGRYARHSNAWRFTSKSPSLEPDRDETMDQAEDETAQDSEPPAAKPTMMDGGCQTVDDEMAPVSSESSTLLNAGNDTMVDTLGVGQVDEHVQVEARVDVQVEAQVEARVEAQVKVHLDAQIEPQIDAQISQVDPQIDARVNTGVDALVQAKGSPGPQTSVSQTPVPPQSTSGAASMGSLFGFHVPAENSYSRFGVLATAQPTPIIAEQLKQVRFQISHEPQPAYPPPSAALYAPIPETFPKHQDLGPSTQYPTAFLQDTSPSAYPELPVNKDNFEEALEANTVDTEASFAHRWEMQPASTEQQEAASEQDALGEQGEMLPVCVPAAFASYGANVEALAAEDEIHQDGIVHSKQGLKGALLVEEAEEESMPGNVVMGAEVEYDEDGQPIEEGDYDQREYLKPDDDDESISEEEELKDAELPGEEDESGEDDYADLSDQSGVVSESGPYPQPVRSGPAAYEGDEYDESEEEEPPYSHLSGSSSYMQPPRSAPARSSAPVVIDLISDSESDGEGPAPGQYQAPVSGDLEEPSATQGDEDVPMAEAAGALQQLNEGPLQNGDAVSLLSQTQVIDFATRAAGNSQDPTGGVEDGARQSPTRGQSRSPPSASRAPRKWRGVWDAIADEKTYEGDVEPEQRKEDAEAEKENGLMHEDDQQMLDEGAQAEDALGLVDERDKADEVDEVDEVDEEKDMDQAQADPTGAEKDHSEDLVVPESELRPGSQQSPLTILSDSEGDDSSIPSDEDDAGPIDDNEDAGVERQDDHAVTEVNMDEEMLTTGSSEVLVVIDAREPMEMLAADGIEEKEMPSNGNEKHAVTDAALDGDDMVEQYNCIYTYDHDGKKKKKWEHGGLEYHTADKSVMVYNDGGVAVGDQIRTENTKIGEGSEMLLEQPYGILVQVHERVGTRREDDRHDGAAEGAGTVMMDASASGAKGDAVGDDTRATEGGTPSFDGPCDVDMVEDSDQLAASQEKAEQNESDVAETAQTAITDRGPASGTTVYVELLSSSVSSFASQVVETEVVETEVETKVESKVEKEVSQVQGQSSATKDDITDQLHSSLDAHFFGRPLKGVDDVEAEFESFMQEREVKELAAQASGDGGVDSRVPTADDGETRDPPADDSETKGAGTMVDEAEDADEGDEAEDGVEVAGDADDTRETHSSTPKSAADEADEAENVDDTEGAADQAEDVVEVAGDAGDAGDADDVEEAHESPESTPDSDDADDVEETDQVEDEVEVAVDEDDAEKEPEEIAQPPSSPPSQRSSAEPTAVPSQSSSYDLRSRPKTRPVAAEETTNVRRRRSSHRVATSPPSQETTQEESRAPSVRKTRSQARNAGTRADSRADSPDLSVSLARQSIGSRKSMKLSPPNLRSSIRQTSNDAPETDDSVRLAKAALASPSKTGEEADAAELKAELVKRLRTDLRECVAVKNLRHHLDKLPNVIGVVTTRPAPAARAKGGPREYMLSFRITDPGAAPQVCEVQMYRPHKEALPMVAPGDAILFERIKVRALERRGCGLQTSADTSYAVFDGDFDELGCPQIKGPPVEDWQEYADYMGKLKAWYRKLDVGTLEKLDKASKKMDDA